MDQKKVGNFLKNLRKEKELTQEQLAQRFNVSNRSVSRWETGSNLPDISMVVEIADFYGVDVREIIDGERKSELMKEEVREVALKMADYADAEKNNLLTVIRGVSLLGVIFLAVALVLQTFRYVPGVASFVCYICTVIALVAMAIMALFTNGILEKIVKNKKVVLGFKIAVICILGIVGESVLRMLMIVALVALGEVSPSDIISGIENYDKNYYVNEYSGDLDSNFLIFPDNTNGMIEPTFKSALDTNMFDTDGYIILRARYEKEQFADEINRLASLQCTVTFNGEEVTQKVRYDEHAYHFPAYVANDGFDDVYEYALVDEENNSITYILLSYPQTLELSGYEKCLKKDLMAYEIDDVLNQFTIYAHSFDGGKSWIEYSDMNQ